MNTVPKQLFQKILETTYTKRQLDRRIKTLQFYISNRLYAPGNAQIQESVGEQELYWIVSLGEDFFANFTKDNMTDYLKDFVDEAEKIEPMTIFIACLLPDAEIEMLGSKLRKKYGKNFLLNVRHDPDLIGGAAVVWKGVYQDYTIRKLIRDQKEEILDKIKEFVH